MNQDELSPTPRPDGSHEVEAVLAAYLAHLEEGSPPEDFLTRHPESEPALRELLAFIDSIALDLPPPEAGTDAARREMRTTLRWRRLQQFLRVPAQRPRLWVLAASLGIGLSFGAAFAQEPYRVFQPITAVVNRLPPLPASPPEQATRSQSEPTHPPSATREAPATSAPTPTPTLGSRPEPTSNPFVLPALANTGGRESSDRTADRATPDRREQADSPEAGVQTPDHEAPPSSQLESEPSGSGPATPNASATDTPEPTSTPARPSAREPTATPTPTSSPATPSPTASASATPSATQTADPTATETQTPSPTPMEGEPSCDEGTPQPTPTVTPTPTPTPELDETPDPCAIEPTATQTPPQPEVASEPGMDSP